MLALTSAPADRWLHSARQGRHHVTRSSGERAESLPTASVVSGPGSLGRPPVMADVARLAGVSHQTVSRVLNAHPNVRPETKTRVLQAISELGYRRNTAARALVTRRSATIGVVTINTALFGPTSTLLSVEAAARQAGYFVSVASLSIA